MISTFVLTKAGNMVRDDHCKEVSIGGLWCQASDAEKLLSEMRRLQSALDAERSETSRLRDVVATGWQMLAFAENMPDDAERIAMEVFRFLSDNANNLRKES